MKFEISYRVESSWVNSGNDPGEAYIFSWVSTHKIYLEIVSAKYPASSLEIVKSGKSFRDIPCVTARFLEIVSGICLYGLIDIHHLVVNDDS